jgi:hypothetical protein
MQHHLEVIRGPVEWAFEIVFAGFGAIGNCGCGQYNQSGKQDREPGSLALTHLPPESSAICHSAI